MMKATDELDGRIKYGARLVLSREPTKGELATLHDLFEKAEAAPGNAKGKSNKDLSALTAVASVLFNLDAALTR